ncbi:hypothetical protein [Aliidiomarina minuta]|nr:hypothetical protein [Aliidiomarina minuta]
MDLTALSGVAAPQNQRIDKEDKSEKQQPVQPQPIPPQTMAQISPQAQQMADAEKSLGQRFDVQNLTESDFAELRDELRGNGMISELEAEELTSLFEEGQKSVASLTSGSDQPQNLMNMLQEQVETGSADDSRLGGLFNLFNAMDVQQSQV